MTITDRLNLIFNKNKVIKINIFQDDRRYKTYVRKLDGGTVECEGAVYKVSYDLVYFSGGVASLNFLYDNPEPFDMNKGNIKGELTSTQIGTLINNKVIENIISEAYDRDKKLISTMVVLAFILMLVFGGGIYIVFDKLTAIQEYLLQYESLWKALQDELLQGGFSN